MSQIGIKLANHDFFPIIDDDGKLPIEKELELTTVRDDQESVQINLYRSNENSDLVYVASLIVEDLKKVSCGDATILLKLTLDEDKNLSAEAIDKDSGNKQSLTIPINDSSEFSGVDFNFDDFEGVKEVDSLDVSNFDTSDDVFSFDDGSESSVNNESIENESIQDGLAPTSFDEYDKNGTSEFVEETKDLETPSFEDIEDSENASSFDDFSFTEETDLEDSEKEESDDLLTDEDYETEPKKSSFPTWLKIFLIILIFGLLALVVALFLKNKVKEPKNEEQVVEVLQQDVKNEEASSDLTNVEELSIDELTTEAPKKESEPFPIKEDVSTNIKTTQSEEVPPPSSEKIKKEEVKVVKDGAVTRTVRYRVRWGDTLWDISANYYKNPWAFKRIARYNNIKNPNRIVAGTYIIIPAK